MLKNQYLAWRMKPIFFVLVGFAHLLGWQPQNPPRVDRNLFDVFFISESVGCACGNFGFLIRTTDAGANWLDRSGITNSWIDDLWFANAHIGYGVGETGTVIKTTDAGDNWFLLNSGTTRNLYGVCFPDSVNGWIAGQGGIIRHTTDGGNFWTDQNSGLTLYIFDIEFVNLDTGWACGQNGWVYKTSDGGNTWLRTPLAGADLYGLKCVNGQELWVVGGNGRIFHLTDFGNVVQNWQFTNLALKAVEVKGTKVWICGENGKIFFSSDYGANWTEQQSQTTNYLDEIFFWDENYGWTVGMAGTIRYTQNGGLGLDENLPKANKIFLAPNPLRHQLRFYVEDKTAKITIWDGKGKKISEVFRPNNHSPFFNLTIKDFAPGVYFIRINTPFQSMYSKIVVVN